MKKIHRAIKKNRYISSVVNPALLSIKQKPFQASLLFFTASLLLFSVYKILDDFVFQKIRAAGDTSVSWNFSNSGDYTLSSSSLVEVTSNTARLKTREYSDDTDTSALFHLNEASGNPSDSSSNANTATASNVTYTTGKFGNAASFNGDSSQIAIADSDSLSFTGNNTLEAWTKLTSSFSKGSGNQRMGIIDKGDYQLYYSNESGKIVYELANSSATSWDVIGGGSASNPTWDHNGRAEIDANTLMGTNYYIGTGVSTGDAEVWQYDGTVWTKIGGDGLNSSWGINTYEAVYSLSNDGTNVYAGLGNTAGDAEVWRWNGSSWAKIGGDATNSSWAISTYEAVYSLYWQDTYLYAGLGNTAGDAEIWRWNGTAWTKIGGDSINSGWASVHEWVTSLTGDGTNIYAGLGSTAGDADVYRWNGSSWSQIGGDALNSSWAASTFESVYSLTYYGGNLYAGLGLTANDAEVWRYNGTSWAQIGGDSLNSGWTTNYEAVYSLVNDGTNLYAGLGSTAGDNEVWRWNGTAWTKIGGDGLGSSFSTNHTIVYAMAYGNSTLYATVNSGSTNYSAQVWTYVGSTWTQIGGDSVRKSWGHRGIQTVETLTVAGNYLYAGTGNTLAGNAVIWQFDGTNWAVVGGQGVNSSWTPFTYENVLAMVSYNSNIHVALGSSTGDAEVWSFNESTWTKVGGDGANSSWNTNYEEVTSLAVLDGLLYAGTGTGTGDAEVYSWNGSAWTKIGGDGVNSSWNTNYERVTQMHAYNGQLYAALGSTAGDAEVWRWNGTAWSQIGGDTLNSSWANSTYEQVDSMIVYKDTLVAGLGTTADDAEVWTYNGSSWTKIGGDNQNSSWEAGTYEQAQSMITYNGELYVGLGNTAGDGEIWRWNGSAWSQIGGDNLNGGWAATIEEVQSFSVYRGRLFTGTGNTANSDANIWMYGNNAYLESSTSSFNTDWRHIAGIYNGSTMSLYINGVLDNSTSASVTIPNSTRDLLIGATYAGREAGKPRGVFDGLIDEVRISDTARSSGDLIATGYTPDPQTVQPTAAVMTSQIKNWEEFLVTDGGVGSVTFRLSDNNGTSWKYWDGGAWATSSTTSNANTESDINTNISTFPVTSSGILWQAVLDGNGEQQVSISSVEITATQDNTAPTQPSSLTATSSNGGSSITTNTWYSHTGPYFTWSGATDTGGSGVYGYYVYFGTDNTANPETAGSYQAGTTYTASSLESGSTYYLRIKTVDNAQNKSATWEAFTYKFDNTAPTNPAGLSVSPSGYASSNNFTFSWPAGSDTGSNLAGYQYKTGASSGPLSDWSATTTDTSVVIADAAYQADSNTFYLRTIDNAGNINPTILQTNYFFAGEGPSAPRFLSVTPSTNTVNSFAFSWQIPESYGGSSSELTYCYTVNTLPTLSTCTYTSAGATSISASAFATQVGLNTFYLVAKNPVSAGGVINYGAYTSVTFTANTSAPGIPLNTDIADISIKSTEAWRLTVSWSAPTDTGSGVSQYQIYRSTDNNNFSFLANTSGAAYVDTGLTQQTYYYKVRACDNVNNCGAFTSVVSMLPTGKYTEPAAISGDPTVTDITTKKATINWSTDRFSDSKVQYGTSSDNFFDEEPSNSTQTTDHTITITNLSPGTTYYYKAKWTDEDGNTGISDEFSFKTEPAPSIMEAIPKNIGISSALIQFTVSGASKVKLFYGETTAFGGVLEITTSTSESTYNALLNDLKDGTKYFYKLVPLDIDGAEYDNQINSFETLPRPKISDIKIQQVKGTAQPTVIFSWTTNTETSSIVTYYPEGNTAEARDEVNITLTSGLHRVLVRGLKPQTNYVAIVKGRDVVGNEASSEPNKFTTSTDTRPPLISDLKIEGGIVKSGDGTQLAQLIVSWNTDEPASSQIEYGEGTGSTYSQKTQLDTNLTYNHLVVISGLQTSKAYHLRVLSNDQANNEVKSIDTVTITPKATDNALDLVISNLQEAFGFIEAIK